MWPWGLLSEPVSLLGVYSDTAPSQGLALQVGTYSQAAGRRQRKGPSTLLQFPGAINGPVSLPQEVPRSVTLPQSPPVVTQFRAPRDRQIYIQILPQLFLFPRGLAGHLAQSLATI